MHVYRRYALRALLLASTVSAVAIPDLSHAEQAKGAATDVEAVVVTGSRIRRDTFNAPLPISTVSAEQIRASGNVGLGDTLMEIPQIDANTNSQNSPGTLFLSGEARVDIRGLGASRTLVLMDGRRLPSGDASSPSVDLNLIPSLMIDRIETQPGGVSAVYGSEAISGVVNLIMRKSFDGLQIDAQAGTSQHRDGQTYEVGAMWGRKFLDNRLSVIVGGEFAREEPIMQVDRADDGLYPGIRRDSASSPQGVVPASRSNTSPYATFQFTKGGLGGVTVDVRDPTRLVALTGGCASATVLPSCQDPALFYSAIYNELQGRVIRGSVRGYADYQLTDQVKVYGETSYAYADGYGVLQPVFSSAAGGGTMPVSMKGDNAFLTTSQTAAAQQLRGYWSQSFGTSINPFVATNAVNVGKFWQEFGLRNSDVRRHQVRVVGGAEGAFDMLGRTIHWDGYAQYGQFNGTTFSPNEPNIARVQQATDAVVVNGQVVCRSTAAQAAGCVPWDLINGGSRQAIAWTNAASVTTQSAKQTVVAANATFDLIKLPAGSLAVALGAEYRKEQSAFVQDPLAASGALFVNPVGSRTGQFDTREAYAEVRIPILRDLPFAYDVSVEGAARVSDYSTIGQTSQWRLAGEWAPVQDIRFRGSVASAVRAPNIVELYASQSRNFTTTASDPCDKDVFRGATASQQAARRITCAAAIQGWNPLTFTSNIGSGRSSLPILQGGNPDLGPETAETWDLGVVIQPRWVSGLKLSVDFFKYNIANEIGTVPVNTLFQSLCYDAAQPISSNPFCALIQRDSTGSAGASANGQPVAGGVNQVVLTNQNVSRVKVEGFDISAAYGFDLADLFKDRDGGRIALQLDVSDTYNWALQGSPSQAYTQFANTINNATPRWKATGSIGWTHDRLYLGWTTHFLGSMISNNSFTPAALSPYYTGDYFEHDLRGRFKLNDQVDLRAGVLNVTNTYPPYLPETFAGTGGGSSSYDNRGRFFYVGATLRY